MKRADEKLLEAITALAGAFKSLGVPAMVIGGIAVIARGVPRHTVDVDAAATPEDLVVYKAVAWRDRDKSDIERLLVLHGRSMNLVRVRALVKQFSETLEEPERLLEFDKLVAQALTPGR